MALKHHSSITIDFVKEYGNQRCLWDNSHVDYKDRSAREKAMKEIGEILGLGDCNTGVIKVKIRSLRSSYWNERAKILKYLYDGKIYRPRVPWFAAADAFLRTVVTCKDPAQNEMALSDILSGIQNTDDTRLESMKKETTENDKSSTEENMKICEDAHVKNDFSMEEYPSDIWEFSSKNNHYPQEPVTTISNATTIDLEEDNFRSTQYERNNRNFRQFSQMQNADEFDVFGMGVSMQLKNMPLDEALVLQADIQALISQRRVQNLNRKDDERVTRGST